MAKDKKTQADEPKEEQRADVFPLRRDQAEFLASVLPTAVYPNLNAETVGIVLYIAQQLRQWLTMQASDQKDESDESRNA